MRTIFLTGFSGTGKSTIARLLGARLGLPLRDLDEAIIAAAGRPIAEIFVQEGEVAFRRRETAALREAVAAAARGEGAVVATGGGIVTIAENRELMLARGWVVCLEALPETIHARLAAQLREGGDGGAVVRPLLDAPDPLARIRTLKEARQPAYATAHLTVHTDRLMPQQVADEVARAVTILERAVTPAGAGARAERGFPFGAKWFGRDRPLLCVPVVASTIEEGVEQARRIAALAPDAIELRADHLADLTPEGVDPLLARLAEPRLPVVFTNRAVSEGGASRQDEGARLAIIEAAIESGRPALVDLELATLPDRRGRLLAAARRHGVPVMLSSHDFERMPDDATLLARLREMAAAGADAAKIAVMARDEDDAIRLLAICRAATENAAPGPPILGGAARANGVLSPQSGGAGAARAGGGGIPLVAMAMGPFGVITRVLGHRAGSALTFAAAAAGCGSAPGQLTVAQLRACWAATSLGPDPPPGPLPV